jgi:hypothetical protein
MADIAVRPLIEYAAAVPRIAAWFYEEWGAVYGGATQASVRRRIETWLTRRRIPTALVAVANNQVIGTVALKQSELKFPYSPWLADSSLSRSFVEEAFYERLGWSAIEHCRLPTGLVAVMSKRLQPSNADEMTGRLTCNQ